MPGEVLADSASLQWPGLYVRRYRFPRVVDRFLVPATPEPLISCGLTGSAEFRERELGETWVTRQIGRGDIFVTRRRRPTKCATVRVSAKSLKSSKSTLRSITGLKSLEAVYPGKGDEVDVIDFFGRDEAYLLASALRAPRCFPQGRSVNPKRVADLAQLIASFLAETIWTAPQKAHFRGGLPIRQLRKVEDHVHENLAEDISVEALAELVEFDLLHFSRVFKHATGCRCFNS